MKPIFLIYCLILLSSCNREEMVTTYYASGSIMEQFHITQDSLRNGSYLKFTEKGDTLEKASYNKGKLEGERILYYDGNKPEIREYYIQDSLDGMYYVYYEEGGVKLQMNYQHNVLNDVVTKYYPSGAVMEEVTFENNIEEGPFTEYYENGQKKWEGTYTDGDNEIGLLVHFAENGDTIRKMMCDDRYICRTIWENDQYK
jgi:antitoxin component YwqK of YwqJK toxin-antitoxin module